MAAQARTEARHQETEDLEEVEVVEADEIIEIDGDEVVEVEGDQIVEVVDADQVLEVQSQDSRNQIYMQAESHDRSQTSSQRQNAIQIYDESQLMYGSSDPTGRSYEHIQLPVVGCMPGCKKGCNPCTPDYDYSKNYLNALNQRPGEFAEYNWLASNYYLLQ